MFIKHFFDIRPEELRLIESPRVAAETVRKVLSSPHSPRASLFFYSIPGFGSGTKNSEYPRLLDKLASGELCLIYSGIGSDTPRSPAVVWQDRSGKSSGGWRCALFGESIPGLERTVETLNRKGVTPSDIGRARSPGGDARSNPDQHAGPSDHKPSLPLGAAASVLPIAAAAGNESQPDDSEGVHVVLGLFTDGTLNNYDNIEEFREKAKRCLDPDDVDLSDIEACRDRLALELGDSYANAPTNVIKLFDLYREGEQKDKKARTRFVREYEPGAGTQSGESDSIIGMATGLGDTGVIAQVERLFKKVARTIARDVGNSKIQSISVDLFGFSRGAAAARHASNQILKGKDGEMAKAMLDHDIKWPDRVTVRFLGLFDTVAGIVNPTRMDLSPGNDRNSPLKLYVNPHKIVQAVHLVAKDEKRANFSLNSIKLSGNDIADNFREIELPGAHSDIGGGYPEQIVEELLLHPKLTVKGSMVRWPKQTPEWDVLEVLRSTIDSEGWIGCHSLKLDDGRSASLRIDQESNEHPLPDGRVDLYLRMRRLLKGEYSHGSLRVMHRLARSAGVPLKPIPNRRDMSLPGDLEAIFDSLLKDITNGEDEPRVGDQELAFIRQRYLHHSDNYNLLEGLISGTPFSSEYPFDEFLHPLRPSASRARLIHFNAESS